MTTTPDTALTSGDRRTTRERPGPLGRLAGVAYRRKRRVIFGWLAAFALVIGLSTAFAGDFAADYSAPGSDSKQAQDLLAQRFPVQAGDTVHVVVRSAAGVGELELLVPLAIISSIHQSGLALRWDAGSLEPGTHRHAFIRPEERPTVG